jgi:hypothetical protein
MSLVKNAIVGSLLLCSMSLFLSKAATAQDVGAINFRGSIPLVGNNCAGGQPSRTMPIDQRLEFAYFQYRTTDRTLGLNLSGGRASVPYTSGTVQVRRGVRLTAFYQYFNLDKRRKTARLRQQFIYDFGGGQACSYFYEGRIRGR